MSARRSSCREEARAKAECAVSESALPAASYHPTGILTLQELQNSNASPSLTSSCDATPPATASSRSPPGRGPLEPLIRRSRMLYQTLETAVLLIARRTVWALKSMGLPLTLSKGSERVLGILG